MSFAFNVFTTIFLPSTYSTTPSAFANTQTPESFAACASTPVATSGASAFNNGKAVGYNVKTLEFAGNLVKLFRDEDGKLVEKSAPYMDGTKLGNYLKSAHYADEALGELIEQMDEAGLLENTVIVIYGDHDSRIGKNGYDYMYNYDPITDTVLTEEDDGYVNFNDYDYELIRKVPLKALLKGFSTNNVFFSLKNSLNKQEYHSL